MNEKTRLRKGEAKIQFLACGERIAELRASGLDIKSTYMQLVKENLVTMTYTGFYENVSQRQKKRSRKGQAEAAANLPAVAEEPQHQEPLPSVKALPAPAENSVLPIPAKTDLPSGSQVAEWSLDEKLAVINAGSTSKKAKRRGFDEETEEYNETEVL